MGLEQIQIWGEVIPDIRATAGQEKVVVVEDRPIGGKPWTLVGRVAVPTITVFTPRTQNTGITVLVFPGGGYNELAIDLEGTEVCEWLVTNGMTAVLLKYRVPGEEGFADQGYRRSGPYPKSPLALQDAQRAIRLLRHRSKEWGINPSKIGVMGFSAGGHLVAAMSTHFDGKTYNPTDEIDQASARPDFAVAVYPGKLWNPNYVENPEFKLNPHVPVSSKSPATFIVHAQDDPVDDVNHSLVYYIELKKAGVPAEMHLYAKGGHAFGLRYTESPITRWADLFKTWVSNLTVSPTAALPRPNQSMEPTATAVTPRADARVAPAVAVAHH